jgi:predicted acetyltransferase
MSDARIDLRAGTADDWDAVSGLLNTAFHNPPESGFRDIEGSVFEPERALLAEDDGALVGHAAAYTRDLTVPGAVVSAAHVTLVAVLPTHRRQRILTRMMHRQLREIRTAGREAMAVLWASEGRIYPRFGYGMAAQRLALSVPHREVSLPGPPAGGDGRLRFVDPAASWSVLARVYEQQRTERTGWSSRGERWWQFTLADPPARRGGTTELRAALFETPHGPAGYALWRVKGGWASSGPQGEVRVQEVTANTPEAYRALWQLLLSIDLARTTSYPMAAVDEPLVHLVDEPRRLNGQFLDSLWVRLVDLPRALTTRRYATTVDVVVDVTDALLPENAGRWRLTAGPDGASCTPADSPADLACDVRELGAAYLGGVSLAALGAAGRVREHTPGSLAAASAAFGWHRLPSAPEVF